MDEGKVDQMYLENLDEWILEENKVVTYKFLSRSLKVHVNTAKQMLWNFVQTKQGSCKGVVYLVSGQLKAEEGKGRKSKVCLVREEDLEKTMGELEKVFSQHVYSVQLNETIIAASLYATDNEVFKEDPFACCQLAGINNPAAVLRPAVAAPKITPGVRMVKAEVKKETKKVGGIENAFAKTKKSSDEPIKSSSASSAKEEKPKSAEKKSNSLNSNSKKPQAAGKGIANFFSKQTSKPKVVENKSKSEENKCENKNEEKENVANQQDNQVVSNSKEEKVKEVKKQSKKPETKSFGKRDKEVTKVLDDTKKRKRIQVMSDSEEDEKSDEERQEEGEETECVAPPQAKLLQSDDEDEEVIPATPKQKVEGNRTGRRRVRKQVDKTYVDSDGYMVTKKVVESGSETDEEVEKEVEKKETKPEPKKVEPKKEDEEAPPVAKKAKVAKVAAPGAKAQPGIMNFFKKK